MNFQLNFHFIELFVIISTILVQMKSPIAAGVFLIALFEAVLITSEAGCLL